MTVWRLGGRVRRHGGGRGDTWRTATPRASTGTRPTTAPPNSGAAYVFVRDGGGVWSQQAYLKASNTGGTDEVWLLGGRVRRHGGGRGVVTRTATPRASTGTRPTTAPSDSGAAYVFVRDGASVWSQQAYLKASNTDADDYFGYSVAVSGDTVVVGASGEDSNATGVNGGGRS